MSETDKEAVLTVFATLARPLMRVAFEYGITASEISGVIRRIYIEALESRLREQMRETSDARLAVVSGLTKSEIASVREALRTGAPHSLGASVSLDQIQSLLTVWHTHPSFSGAYGFALDLDLHATSGSPRRCLRELIDVACPTADVDAVLDELILARSAELIDGSTVRCLSRAYVPRGADVKRIERMGRFLGVVAANFVHNLLRNESEPAYFERLVMSDYALSERGRDEFLTVAGRRGQELLSELDTFLARLAMSEATETGKKYGVGVYFFEEEASVSESTPKPTSDSVKEARATTRMEEIDLLAMPKRRD